MSTYPQPATPLPWTSALWYAHSESDRAFARHAANAFPHLVAALEVAAKDWRLGDDASIAVSDALAIARGETAGFAKAPERE